MTDIVLDTGISILSHGERRISCGGRRAAVLIALSKAGADGLSKSEIYQAAWPHVREPANTHTLETTIYRIRGELAGIGVPDAIKTDFAWNNRLARFRLLVPIRVIASGSGVNLERTAAEEIKAWVAANAMLPGAARIQGLLDAAL
jgi:hypothetical protein